MLAFVISIFPSSKKYATIPDGASYVMFTNSTPCGNPSINLFGDIIPGVNKSVTASAVIVKCIIYLPSCSFDSSAKSSLSNFSFNAIFAISLMTADDKASTAL